MRKFIVLGAGLSGLSSAFHLLKRFPQSSITILESSHRVGGSIKTTNKNGYICEEGPRSIRNTKYCKQLFEIVDEIGLRDQIIPSNHQPYNYIWWDGKLRKIPYTFNIETMKGFYNDHQESLIPLLKTLQGALTKQSKLKKQIDEKDISIYDFIEQLGGDDIQVNQKFAETVFYGVYGTSVRNISTQMALFKKHLKSFGLESMKKEEMAKYKSFRFKQGLEQFPNTLCKYLQKHENVNVKLNCDFKEINLDNKQVVLKNGDSIEYDNLFLTIPVKHLKNTFINRIKTEESEKQNVLSEIQQRLSNIKTSGLISKNLCFNKQVLPDDVLNFSYYLLLFQFKGFGYLINPNQSQKILGMITDSLLFPSMNPDNTTTLSLMGLPNNQATILQVIWILHFQFNIFSTYLDELHDHLQLKRKNILEPEEVCETIWKDQFPIYHPGYFQNSQEIIKLLDRMTHNSLSIGGVSLFSAAMPELIMQQKYLVDRI